MSQSDDKRLTPMLAQYRNIRTRFPDSIVLFRLGDFYETFEADAETAARELGLVLTARSFAKGVRLKMAGVPHHHVQSYIARLIEKGYKVALVEQLEDPKKVKRLVKRDVIRVITPGTVVEDGLLRRESANYLGAIVRQVGVGANRPTEPAFGLALVDISTGEFATTQVQGADAENKLLDEIQRVQASEYVLPQALVDDADLLARLKRVCAVRLSPVPDRWARSDEARRELCEHFGTPTLDSFGCAELPLATAAAGAVLRYLKENQPQGAEGSTLIHLNHLWTYSLADYMLLDAATRRNLELVSSLQGDGAHNSPATPPRSLYGVLNHTVTAMGARLLQRWVQQPLLDLGEIAARLDAVDELQRDAFLRADLRRLMDGLYDVERLVGRIGFGSANARDLIALKRALLRLPLIKSRLGSATTARLLQLGQELDELTDMASLIDRALLDDPPILIREGGLLKMGYDPTLDELRDGAARGKEWLGELEEKEKRRTGIKALRVRYNEVFGFFIEVPRSQGHLIPKNYERRATISHAERYVMPELKTQEAQILATQDRVKDLEYELFVQIRREVATHSARLSAAARILAQLDVLASLAEAAARYGYCKPLVDEEDVIDIREGRHPVVECFLPDGQAFVPNDAHLDSESQRVIILTGPNMSGKSVFVRQVALIVLMAQIGSFVPAQFARVGLTDRIFTRVGASDDIAQGRSTFLVEMSETSHILRHATARSLVILDEVGRGTSTYDGISLAWAIAEELHNSIGSKTLFASHYHELTLLENADEIRAAPGGSAIRNFTMAVKELGNEVVFLRQVIRGGAEKSFGIHVARLAGLPDRVVARADAVLRSLEQSRGDKAAVGGEIVVSERAVAQESKELYDARAARWREVLHVIADANVANMTPMQALNLLNEMQIRIKEWME